MFISGSAPINQDITKWFTAMGMPIAEGYGLTEGCITHLTRLDAFRVGTIGWPLPGVDARLADDGELLIKSDWNLLGYHNRPEATEEVLPGDGYMHTGDIARVDDGYFYITDRKKSLFKTSNGKYVAPAAIESEFKGLCPIAMELATYGEGHKYIVGMVVLEKKATEDWCKANGVEVTGSGAGAEDGSDEAFAAMTRHPKVIEFVQQCLAKLNERLNTWEQVKRFRILDRELSIERDELTASLKMRRKHVHATFKEDFEAIYNDPLEPGCFDSAGVTWVSFEQPALTEHPVLDDAHDIHLPHRRRH
nr:AMP-binding protein [Corynebacterium lactis]